DVGVELAVVADVQEWDAAGGLDELEDDSRRPRLGDADQDVDVAVHRAEQGQVLEQGGPAVVLEDVVEQFLDGGGAVGVGGGAADGEGPAEHEVDHGVDSPGDVVFDDDLAGAGASAGGGRFLEVGVQPRGQALLLGQAVAPRRLGAAVGQGVAVV